MVEQLRRPKRKNPLRRSRQQALPYSNRSRAAQLHTLAAAEGRLRCNAAANVGCKFCYPAHDACPQCLSADLPLNDAPNGGILVPERQFGFQREDLLSGGAPWQIGLIKLDCGPIMVAHLHADCRDGEVVRMSLQLDKAGQAAAFAHPAKETENTADDRRARVDLRAQVPARAGDQRARCAWTGGSGGPERCRSKRTMSGIASLGNRSMAKRSCGAHIKLSRWTWPTNDRSTIWRRT